jgi:uncharacterized protein (TIGR00369 family)
MLPSVSRSRTGDGWVAARSVWLVIEISAKYLLGQLRHPNVTSEARRGQVGQMAIAKMSVAELDEFLRVEFPQVFGSGDTSIESADGETCLIRQRYSGRMLRPGGTISGPTLMALADCAMYVVLLSAIGPVGLAVTTNLNINFLRKGSPGQDVLAAARILKLGKRLAVGEVNLLSGTSPDPIAHVTATYSIPNA